MLKQAYSRHSGAFSSLRDGGCCCIACANRGDGRVESLDAGQLDDPGVFWIQYIEQLRDPWTREAMLGLGPSSYFQQMLQVCTSDATGLLLERKRLCDYSTTNFIGGAISPEHQCML